VGKRNSGSDAMTSDDAGVLYYSLLENSAVMRWNAADDHFYHERKLLVRDEKRLQWINSMFVDNGYLWVVSNRYY
jgi:hypothetical protein